jgi:uncharacterized protein (TIGR00725 family)
MRTRLVAVVGSGGGLSPEQAALAEELGAGLARAGYGIVCGGLGGVMEAVARGAVAARGDGRHPPVVGLLPGYDAQAANRHVDVVLPTGLGHARNTLVAAAGEVVICVAGAMGALSEMALACKLGRPVLAFPESGGAARIADGALEPVVAVKTVPEALAAVEKLLG